MELLTITINLGPGLSAFCYIVCLFKLLRIHVHVHACTCVHLRLNGVMCIIWISACTLYMHVCMLMCIIIHIKNIICIFTCVTTSSFSSRRWSVLSMGTYTIQYLTSRISRFSPGLTGFCGTPRTTLVGSYKSRHT